MRNSVLAIKDLAYKAGRNISMDPDKFGEHLLLDLENGLDDFLKEIPQEFHEEYEAKYIAKYSEWLRALSHTFSILVTGGANFNNKRHDKMNTYAKSALKRLQDWREVIVKRLNRQKRLVGWKEVERLQNKLYELNELQVKMKSANKIVRNKKLSEKEQYEELAAIGFCGADIKSLMEGPSYSFCKKGFQTFELSNNLAKIKATEQAIAQHTKLAESEDTQRDYNWGSIEYCYSEERLRLHFNEIPSEELRTKLKRAAFKWSPKNKAWQRQLSDNAIRAAKRVMDIK